MRQRFIFFFLSIILISPAHAGNLKTTTDDLEVLPLEYGTNNFHINGHDVLIVKGKFKTPGTAWGGDIYTVLQREDDVWQTARREKGGWNSVLAKTVPHTYEDSISTVRFLIPKKRNMSEDSPSLYMLEASRRYLDDKQDETVPSRKSYATFTLSVLHQDEEFGVLYLHELIKTKSAAEYCNVDWAVWKEIGIMPPDDGHHYECQ